MEIAFSDCWYWLLLAAAVSYLLGCINFAVIISKMHHKDVRKIGSGNPGTMNMSREFGLKVGLVNFLFDCAKGESPLSPYIIYSRDTRLRERRYWSPTLRAISRARSQSSGIFIPCS